MTRVAHSNTQDKGRSLIGEEASKGPELRTTKREQHAGSPLRCMQDVLKHRTTVSRDNGKGGWGLRSHPQETVWVLWSSRRQLQSRRWWGHGECLTEALCFPGLEGVGQYELSVSTRMS